MSTIANLDIAVRGRTTDFDAKLNATKAKIVGFAGFMKSKASTFGTAIFEGIGQGLGHKLFDLGEKFVTKLFSPESINATVERMSKLSDAADRIGMDAGLLRQFQYAGQQAGMGADDVTSAIQTMMVSVSKAAAGNKKLNAGMLALGMDAKALEQQAPADVFKTLTSAIEGVDNPLQRMRLAMLIFKDAKIVNMIKGMADQMQRASFLHLDTSGIKVSQIEEVGDRVADIGHAFEGAQNEITSNFQPAIGAAADAMVRMIVKVSDALTGDKIGWNSWQMQVATAFDAAEENAKLFGLSLKLSFLQVGNSVHEMVDNIISFASPLAGIGMDIAKFFGEGDGDKAKWAKVEEKLKADIEKQTQVAAEAMHKAAIKRMKEQEDLANKPRPLVAPPEKDKKEKAPKALQMAHDHTVGAERGSKEAYDIIAAVQNSKGKWEEQIVQETKRAADAAERIDKKLEEDNDDEADL